MRKSRLEGLSAEVACFETLFIFTPTPNLKLRADLEQGETPSTLISACARTRISKFLRLERTLQGGWNMKLRRMLLIVVAVLTLTFAALSFGAPWLTTGTEPTAGACQRCGDGYCAKSCENKYTCPQDCGGTGTGSAQ